MTGENVLQDIHAWLEVSPGVCGFIRIFLSSGKMSRTAVAVMMRTNGMDGSDHFFGISFS